MIAHQAKWATPACQQCHDNRERFGAEITSFPLATWWAGERYSASLQSTGRAARIAAAATRRLDAAPDDADARLRLAYARRALGDVAGMEQALRALPWAAFPDRTYREPRDLLQFP
jgi:thioredoxin-like negative regulator of GroEL